MSNRKLHNIRPSGDVLLEVTSSNVTRRDSVGRVGACATGSCAISDQTSQVGLPLKNMWARMRDWKCPCGALYDVRVLLSFFSPFTGYLPLSRHFIFMGSAFNNYISYKSLLFSDMYFFPYFFKPQRLKCNVFLVHGVIKHFIFPYFFPF